MHGRARPPRMIALRRGAIAAGIAVAGAVVAVPATGTVHAAGGLIVSEVAPWSSGSSSVAADWFEVTNTSGVPIGVTGWSVDDSSASFAASVPLSGISSIGAGESVIYLESATPAIATAFVDAWFGGTKPAGLQIGTYSGSGVGLSTGGDAVNLYDSTQALRASVTFGPSPGAAPFATFDNAVGLDATAISTLSSPGVNGAFAVTTAADNMVGSPGTIVNAPGTPPPSSTTSTLAPTTTVTPGLLAWPGDPTVRDASSFAFGGNMSGLIADRPGGTTPGVLWAVRNGPGSLFRLVWDGTKWTPDTTNEWTSGKALHYPDGSGDPDAEGVTFAGPSSAGGIFVSTERNNLNNGVSKLSVLRYDTAAAGTSLNANMEWDLTADLPPTGPNLGLEAITWVPDSFLVANGFADEHTAGTYDPATYPNHGDGLFLVGVEGSGMVYADALDQVGGGFVRVAAFTSGFPAVMELQFDRDLNELWAVCDNTCGGQHHVLRIAAGTGRFAVAEAFARPTGLPDFNNEGFAIAPATECVADRKPVYWADDTEDLGVAIRAGNIPCTAVVTPPADVPEFPAVVLASITALGLLGGAVLIARRRRAVPAA